MLTWLRKHTKTIMIAVAVVFAGSMFYGLGFSGQQGGSGGGGSKGIAKVNGREIDQVRYQELLNRVAQSFGGDISPSDMAMIENLTLGQAIDFTLMVEEARKKVKVSGSEIDGTLDQIMKQQQIPSKRELEVALKRLGLTVGKFRDLLRDDILLQKFQRKMQEEIKVTPDDLREIRASHILLSNEATAKLVLAQLKAGGDFAALAKAYSRDPGSAAQGGDLGYFKTGSMLPEFERAVLALKPGELSGIVKTPFGYHLIKVADSRLRKFSVPDAQVEQLVLREKQESTMRQWFGSVKAKAKIEVLNPALRAHDYRFKGMAPLAIAEYKKAIAQDPANPFLPIYLGDTYMMLGRKDLALVEYENAVKVQGGNPALYLVLGKAYEAAGERNLAAEQYKKASLVAGDSRDVHEKLLKLFQQMKRPAEVAREKAELQRIGKKEAFEKELTGGK
ncbi:MAG: peptidylprolyl isomerase [Candidatus Margulisiibacteriota bacterium]